MRQLIHSDDLFKLKTHIDALLLAKDGEILSLECRVKIKNGDYRWQRSYDSVFRRTKSGSVWQSIGIVFDIQNEKRIAEQLQHREEELLEAQELAGLGSFEWNLSTGNSVSTPQVFKILGLQSDFHLEDFIDKVHPSDKCRVKMSIDKAVKENGIYDAEYRYVSGKSEKILWSRGAISVREGQPVMKGTVMDITDRHHIIQRLQRSEELYKQAQAITHIGNYTWSLTGNTFTWSDELYRIYGEEPQSDIITYEKVATYNHPDDARLVTNHIQESIQTLEPFNFYYRIILPDKTVKILHARGEALTDEAGKPYKLLGTAQDVTDRQQLIQRLQQSDDLYKQAQALTHIGNWTWDIALNKLTWSEELYRIFKLDVPSGGITFEKYFSYVHPEDKALVTLHIKEPHDLYYRIVLHDGSIKTIHGKGEVLLDETGNTCKMLGTSQDVTEEKMVEKELRENRNFIQKIADAIPSIITSYNINTGKYSFVNQGFDKLLGYQPEQLLNEGISFVIKLIHPDDLSPLMEKNAQALEMANAQHLDVHNEMVVEFQYRMLHKNGQYRWFHTFGTVFDRNSNNEVENLLNISLDITDRVEAEQVVFAMNLELQQSNASLKEFAYVASHDLQEPLRKISTFGDRLLYTHRDKFNEEGKMYLEKIINSSIRMQQLINDLLSISIISGNKSFETYSLQHILNEVLLSLEHTVEQRKAVITSANLPEVNIVASQFRHLFQNLISNSIKFTSPQVVPLINISFEYLSPSDVSQFNLPKSRTYLQLTFTDNGIGFDKIFADKIFAIFQRLHNRSEYEGTGIGLAICKKIIENHGGVIFASGTMGRGATFTIIIPG
ncbi:MAG: PAS domain-containing protein [Chitinophagaceae bacterium]